MKIKVTFTEELLGTKASNPDVFRDFIASKHPSGTPQKDELDNAEHREEAGTTVFHRMPGVVIVAKAIEFGWDVPAQLAPLREAATKLLADRAHGRPERKFEEADMVYGVYDYQLKGFFKDACSMLRQADKALSKKLKAYKSKIDGLIHTGPRFIPMELPPNGAPDVCERPLRAETMQGPRVSLCRSETVPIGSTLTFQIRALCSKLGKEEESVDVHNLILEWLRYGKLRGIGQWRNSGKGRFEFEVLDDQLAIVAP